MPQKLMVEYPSSLPDVLQESRDDFEREAKLAMAMKLFEMKRLSSGQAASLVGMGRVQFLLSLHHYGIPMIDLSDDELEMDFRNA
jgi:predicted HTH domain antitoxin